MRISRFILGVIHGKLNLGLEDLRRIYELCCVPVSLLHPDGRMCRTAKSSPVAISKTNRDSLVSLPVSSKITAVLIDAIVLI